MLEINHIYQGNCLELMKEIDDNSIDAVVTDPPYELGFMGKSWDSTGIANNVEVWKSCLRVLKPGGYLLSFGGTRTYHRMVCAIEDAGFEIRDMIEWIYGSGFPKSLDISKAIDKQGGESLAWFIDYILKIADERKISRKELIMLFPSKNGNPTGWLWNKQKTQGITIEQFNVIKNFLELPFESLEEVKREVIEKKTRRPVNDGTGNDYGIYGEDASITAPSTPSAIQWQGWGTALKPAHEPICMARKPLSEKTVAENVLKYGTGGINIDECRVETLPRNTHRDRGFNKQGSKINKTNIGYNEGRISAATNLGRFPANLIHDGSDVVMAEFEKYGILKSGSGIKNPRNGAKSTFRASVQNEGYYSQGDSGTPARFFYCAKASKSERDMGCEGLEEKEFNYQVKNSDWNIDSRHPNGGYAVKPTAPMKNHHPTVKPIKLMEYLIKLVTTEKAIVLDPFAGSGSTLIACRNLGRNYIGIEKEADYIEIANKRIEDFKQQLVLV